MPSFAGSDVRQRRDRFRARSVAARPGSRDGDRRRDSAAAPRPRCPDRQRDPPAPSRRFEGAHGAAARACAEDRAAHARPRCRRDRSASGRRRTATTCARRTRHPAPAAASRVSMHHASRIMSSSAGMPRGARRPSQAARRQIAKRPPLDLSFADDADARAYAAEHGGDLACTRPCANRKRLRHRLARLWRRSVVGAGSGRVAPGTFDSSRREGRARPLRGAWRQDDAARSGGSSGRRRRCARGASPKAAREPGSDASRSRAHRGGRAYLEAAPGIRRDPSRRALLRNRHLPPPSGSSVSRPPRHYRLRRRASVEAARPRRALAQARRRARLFGLLAGAQEGEDVISTFLKANPGFAIDAPKPSELPDFVAPSPQGWVRILPGLLEQQGGLDGFFMARLVRRGG